ncbi:AraC family transcriptional regulator [Microbacterium lacusdiani]
MIGALNQLVDHVERHLTQDMDLELFAARLGTTEYHLRRMFSSLAGMPLSEYVRRRRMTMAAADVIAGRDLLGVAVRYGYGSTEAFGRALPIAEHARLKELSDTEPAGLLQVSADLDPDDAEGSELTYLHGVAVDEATAVPHDLECIEVPAGAWAVFRTTGAHPEALQDTWAATATEWFPSNPWRLRPGPSIVAVIERDEDRSTATCDRWPPVERG